MAERILIKEYMEYKESLREIRKFVKEKNNARFN